MDHYTTHYTMQFITHIAMHFVLTMHSLLSMQSAPGRSKFLSDELCLINLIAPCLIFTNKDEAS